jgi:phosphatidylglycerophosphate synthase
MLGVKPNTVSMAGIVWAMVAAMAFVAAPGATAGVGTALLLTAAACIQLRLLCNLLDGMLAVEEGLGDKLGPIYNEIPDRVADVIILAGAGCAIPHAYGAVFGWVAATFALGTAYVRVLAGSLGLKQHFIGPMAKQHRMFTLTLATLAAAAETAFSQPPRAMLIGLGIIVAGSLVTAGRRISRMASELSSR